MKILVVDDDENSRIYLERALLSQKYTVKSAANGVLALEIAIKSQPDMIISDIMMPEMDGFELCRRIKATDELKHIPFIFYTATFIEKPDEDLAMSLGASRFIVKPSEVEELFKIIEEVLKEHSEKKLTVPEPVKGEEQKIGEMYSRSITKKLEKKIKDLEESRQSYKTLAENLPGIVYRVFIRENNRTQLFNKAAKNVTGYTEEELIKGEVCSIDPLIIPEDHDNMVTAIRAAIKKKNPFTVEYRIKHKDGNIRHMQERGTPIYGTDGHPLYIDGLIFDITERKNAEEELHKYHWHLEEMVQERTSDLERMNRLFVGRELKMIELKKKIQELEKDRL